MLPEDTVAALHYDDRAVAGDLAAWCGGEVVVAHHPLDLSRDPQAVRVPTDAGAALAWLGDWIVRSADGFSVESHETFVARHEPLA